MKINLGILSSNSNSLNFLINNNLYNLLNFYAVSSRNIRDSKQIASKYGFKKYYGSYEEIINDTEIDIVINFLPNAIKFEYSYLLLKAGKKVITNYPIFNSITDFSFIEEILSSKLSENLFLIYEYDYSRLLLKKSKNFVYAKFSNENIQNKLSLMKNLLIEDSPDLFFLLNHYKLENIKIQLISKKYELLFNKISYLNIFISINNEINFNIIIDNINEFYDQSFILNRTLLDVHSKKTNKDLKVFNHQDLLSFIKNNKYFDNNNFFQYYPYQLFKEVTNE